jgi:F-type H+-transporting ATPase subunit delta
MPLTGSSARRYAEAAFEIAQRDDSVDAWLSSFDVAEARLTGSDVTRLLASPAIPAAAREGLLARLLGDAVSGPPRNLMALLIRRGRFDQLPAVAAEFRRLHRRREGIVEAMVTSAAPLDAAEVTALEQRLATMAGARIELSQRIDASLIGGLQVRLGDRLLDGSVRGRLERLRTRLSETTT